MSNLDTSPHNTRHVLQAGAIVVCLLTIVGFIVADLTKGDSGSPPLAQGPAPMNSSNSIPGLAPGAAPSTEATNASPSTTEQTLRRALTPVADTDRTSNGDPDQPEAPASNGPPTDASTTSSSQLPTSSPTDSPPAIDVGRREIPETTSTTQPNTTTTSTTQPSTTTTEQTTTTTTRPSARRR